MSTPLNTTRALQCSFLGLLMALFLSLQPACGEEVVMNYRSGIDVTFGGQAGVDWTQEYFYFDPLMDDTKVVYIKSSTPIMMSHNERNKRQTNIAVPRERVIGVNGEDGVPASGDEGIIRYRVDEDLQVNSGTSSVYWARLDAANSGTCYPAYQAPFTFAQLIYRNGKPVVGSVGPNQKDITDRANAYYYGLLDEFGDEWHTLAYADDDDFLYAKPDGPWYAPHFEKLASDGKTLLFVVNPKTPCIRLQATGQSQFYTTPAKAYGIPKVHAQTSYIAGDVTITLTNIMDNSPCYYRFYRGTPAGSFIEYTAHAMAASVAALTDNTTYVLEYYYDSRYTKKRAVVKNPAYPSRAEAHGNMLWRTSAELNAIRSRLRRGDYFNWFQYLKKRDLVDRNGHVYWDDQSGQGGRTVSDKAFLNAFIALIEGWEYTYGSEGKSFAEYAKEMLLESVLNLDPLWFGDRPNSPDPSHELLYRGYFDALPVISNALAYDLLIAHYRRDQHPGGLTPIEDYKIRDSLAKWNMLALMETGAFGYYGNAYNAQGMWATARAMAALINAVAMPAYDTPYFGTSGLDGTVATHSWAPFRDRPRSWKAVLADLDATRPEDLLGFPNQNHRADQAAMGTYSGPLVIEQGGTWNGITVEPSDFGDRSGYLGLMGYPFELCANILKITHNKTYPTWELMFRRLTTGVTGVQGGEVFRCPYILLVNEYFAGKGPLDPDSVAAKHEAFMDTYPSNEAFSRWGQLTRNGVYSLILYHDDWRDHAQSASSNRDPVANDDVYTVEQNSPATLFPVLSNDSDPDNDALSLSAVTQPGHGLAVVVTGHTDVSYTPAGGYSGDDSFSYTISDGSGGMATATVHISVTSTPSSPAPIHLINTAIRLDGVDDFVETTTNGWTATSGTISLAGYAEAVSGTRYLFGHTIGTWSNRIQLYVSAGSLCLGLGDSHPRHLSIVPFAPRRWYHVALSWDGTHYVVYVNGIEAANGVYSGLTELHGFADIGNTGNPLFRSQEAFHGVIAGVRIYDVCLTGQQVLGLYRTGSLNGQWKLDGYSSQTAGDSSEHANTATLANGPLWTGAGQMRLDGVNDLVNCGASPVLNQTSSLTLCAWICPESWGLIGDARIADKGDRPAGFAFYLDQDRQGLAYMAGTAEAPSDAEVIRLNQWQHVAVSYSDASDMVSFYVNGQPAGFVPNYQTNPADSAAAPLIIGNTASLGRGFKGMMSDVRLYSRALTTQEIDLIFRTWDVRENKPVVFELAADGYTYVLQGGQTLPAGATFAGGVFSWRPWYNQADTYNLTFEVPGQPGLTQSVPIVVEDVRLNNWYRLWLESLNKY